jgi:sarcosine oxidase
MKVIIIGVGAVGAMAAWRLAEAGHEVVCFEQFSLDHDLGSSYGESRIVRRVYPEAFYTDLMAEAYELWDELQSLVPDQELFSPSGGLFLGTPNSEDFRQAVSSLDASGVVYEKLSAEECMGRYPAFQLQPDEVALYEPRMGYARASQCVQAAVQLAQARGAVFHWNSSIAKIEAAANGVGATVFPSGGEPQRAERLLLSVGPWTQPLLAQWGVELPLQVIRKAYAHLEPERNADTFEKEQFPVWIDSQNWMYGFPRLGDAPGVKIALHPGGDPTTPETVQRTVRESDREQLRAYATARFPDLSERVVYEKVCLYTNTPDEDFIIDAVPGLAGAFLIGGLSGHGFKFTPLLGQIARRLIEGESVQPQLARFALSRFGKLCS